MTDVLPGFSDVKDGLIFKGQRSQRPDGSYLKGFQTSCKCGWWVRIRFHPEKYRNPHGDVNVPCFQRFWPIKADLTNVVGNLPETSRKVILMW